ncbi:DNA (cytosine-5-)-methyltransferase [Bacillus cytotoxicus]|uniref:DNA (cytosine-5-)-methyltransferase n=1 Tax=Bacillus cytotoxicus TaxID=580165 RepID=UPI001AEDA2F1|nr:DNA (cytosine-5-)-methyltransferase [Bacillus cytotoxicus]QTR81826.1 DNA (cytosine-5-)-methyltransferase [Bacillus cytotoxicus]QTR85563.1 DNA (cytosine-5-)-methyltransferase [Bacillus cytotoxicus]HDR4573112.1 DNA (cytosine-5-)-methyltransferase [Bacillus cytotoxicus]HDR4589146.1 DNA (cytosine-5-)-methyltransferase [Bacillus cytotoxicus]
MTFKYVSLFSGVGGFEQALNKLGGKCVMSSEIDKFANQAYEVLYGHKTVGDVTKVAAEDVPNHDLLVGGFPCQAFSVAGKRLGFDDTRGTLFFEVARIAKEKQPKLLLLENVKGLISHDKGKTLDTIIKTLNDIGYTVDFNVLNSKYFGVPQNRERIFIIGVLNGETESWKIEGNNVVAKGKRRISSYEGVKTFNFDWPTQDVVTTRLRDILEDEVDERYYLSEEKTAKLVAQLHDNYPINQDGKISGLCTEENISPTLDASYAKGIGPSDIPLNRHRRTHIVEPQMVGRIDIKGHDAIKRVYSTEGVSPTLTTMGGGHREPKIAEPQVIARGEDLSLCLTSRYTAGPRIDKKMHTHILEEVRPVLAPDRIEKRQNGRRFKENDEPSFTLTAQDRHGVAIREATKQGYVIAEVGDSINVQFPNSKTRRDRVGKGVAQTLETSCNQATLTSSYRIRKLTPKECFRLQGFPDSEFDKLVGAGISNSQLYKMSGNAVTVNVIEAIGTRLLKYLAHNEIGSRYVTEKGA